MSKKIKVLILGKTGMLGRVVYAYLKTRKNLEVWGTSRRPGDELLFDALEPRKYMDTVLKQIGDVDYVINCIGLLRSIGGSKEDFVRINTLLPLELDKMKRFRLIHVSTDAVFASNSGEVDENSKPNPEDIYGMTKYLGEPEGKNSLSIRTSILGFDPEEKKGLLEFVKNSNISINGYTNQTFSGATTLQVAKLCEFTLLNFGKLRKLSPYIHFSPLGPISKHQILSEANKVFKRNIQIQKATAQNSINRVLKTIYLDDLEFLKKGLSLKTSLRQLVDLETR